MAVVQPNQHSRAEPELNHAAMPASARVRFTSDISSELFISKSLAHTVLSQIKEGICDLLLASGNLKITRFGSFEIKDRAPRVGRNPITGESLQIEAGQRVSFRAGKELRELVNAPSPAEHLKVLALKYQPERTLFCPSCVRNDLEVEKILAHAKKEQSATRAELMELLRAQGFGSISNATRAWNAFQKSLEAQLISKGSVLVADVGKFVVRDSQARIGNNLRTGEKIMIEAHKRVAFKPSKSLRELAQVANRTLSDASIDLEPPAA